MKRMGIHQIDLYLIHMPNPGIPVRQTMKAIDRLVDEKIIRYIGVSNFSVEQIKEAQSYTSNKIVTNQIEYNLFTRNKGIYTRNMEAEIIPYCKRNEILITAWRPVLKGMLDEKNNRLLNELSIKYNKTRAQIAINWLLSDDYIISIPKSSNPNHILENLGSVGWTMELEDIESLDAIKES